MSRLAQAILQGEPKLLITRCSKPEQCLHRGQPTTKSKISNITFHRRVPTLIQFKYCTLFINGVFANILLNWLDTRDKNSPPHHLSAT